MDIKVAFDNITFSYIKRVTKQRGIDNTNTRRIKSVLKNIKVDGGGWSYRDRESSKAVLIPFTRRHSLSDIILTLIGRNNFY